MSVSFNPMNDTPSYRGWNYSRPNDPYYSEVLVGTVKAIQYVQAMDFYTKEPKFWKEGDPVYNVRIALADPNGDLVTFTFAKASKAAKEGRKPSIHVDLYNLIGRQDLINLIGRTIRFTTVAGTYGAGNPRPFSVELLQEGPYELREPLPQEFTIPKISHERRTPQPMQMQGYGQPMMQPQYGQPMMQPQGMQMYAQSQPGMQYAQPQPNMNMAPVYTQPSQPQPMAAPQPAAQPMAQPMAQPAMQQPAMDPQIAAAMQYQTQFADSSAMTMFEDGLPL